MRVDDAVSNPTNPNGRRTPHDATPWRERLDPYTLKVDADVSATIADLIRGRLREDPPSDHSEVVAALAAPLGPAEITLAKAPGKSAGSPLNRWSEG